MIWTVAAAVAGMVALLLWRASGAPLPAPDAPDAQVYRDQLKDIARDAARGVIPAEEAERLRTEVARRLLASDAPPAPLARGPVLPVALIAALAAGGAVAAYAWLGAPGYPDLPLKARLAEAEALAAARPSQAEAEALSPATPVAADAEFLALMETLRARLKGRPNDVEGHRLLAENEARLGNLSAARAAQERVVAILGQAAAPADRALLARLMISAAGGTVTPDAEALLAQVLSADAAQPEALFLAGIAQMQVGRPDTAFRLWRRFLEVAPEGDPWRAEAESQMPMLAAAAGANWTPPLRGPSAADVSAAAGVSPEDRAAMAAGMVESLAGRLAAEGGTAAEWAQLVTALGVLGDRDRAKAVYEEAATLYAGRAADLDLLRAAAVAAGIAP